MDWNLVGAPKEHVTYAPDEPELRDRLMASASAGTAWRCLRCGAFVTRGSTAAARPRRPRWSAAARNCAAS